MMLFYENLR